MSKLVSIAIPTYNEEKFIFKCLLSIAKQTIKNVEVLLIDDNSTDHTLRIASQFPFVKYLKSGFKDPEISKKIGLENATGKYFMYLDSDMQLSENNFLETIVRPLELHPNVSGVLTKFKVAKDMNALTRYISYDEFQRDSFLQLFTTDLRGEGYYKFKDKIPCQSLILYRTEILKKLFKDKKHLMDNDVPVILIANGYNLFAYVNSVGVYHYYFNNLKELWNKRVKGVTKSYLPNIDTRVYKWIDIKKNWFLLGCWVVWATLFIPELIRGIYKVNKYKDYCFLYQPVVSFLVTWAMIIGTLKSGTNLKKLVEKI